MPAYQYGPPPWAVPQPNPQAQAPYWAQPQNPYPAYPQQQQPQQPFIPPRPPPQGPPAGYHPSWNPGAQRQPAWGHPPQPQWGGIQQSTQPPQSQDTEADPSTHRSKKWPKLCAILGSDTTLARFKLCGAKPSQELLASTFYLYRNVTANATPTTHMRLFSKDFPWSVEVRTKQDITCADVWNAIWASLQEPLEDSEWGMICASGEAGQKMVQEILKANKKRAELNSFADKRILRCDYLGEKVFFVGLEKDDEYAKMRSLPYGEAAKHPIPDDTWIIKVTQR